MPKEGEAVSLLPPCRPPKQRLFAAVRHVPPKSPGVQGRDSVIHAME